MALHGGTNALLLQGGGPAYELTGLLQKRRCDHLGLFSLSCVFALKLALKLGQRG